MPSLPSMKWLKTLLLSNSMAYGETSQATIKYQMILFEAGDEAEPMFKIHYCIYYFLFSF